jgi:phage-related protein
LKKLEEKIIKVYFFKTSTGKEPVRDWLKSRSTEDKKSIGEDIKMVEFLWPVGYPQIAKLEKDLWEVRTDLQDGISRIFFTIWKRYMVLLHGIIKKTQKLPKQDIDLARKRRNMVFKGGIIDEK